MIVVGCNHSPQMVAAVLGVASATRTHEDGEIVKIEARTV